MSKLKKILTDMCPNGVEYKKFGEIALINRGASPRPIAKYLTQNDDGINWIKIGDTSPKDKYIFSTEQRITNEGAKKSKFVHPGDFVLSNSMSFGRPYISKIDGCIHDGWLSISDFEKDFLPDFLYHILCSANIQYELKKLSSGSTVSNLNADAVRKLVLPVPPLKVQAKLVRILDDLSETSNQLDEKIQEEILAQQKKYEYYYEKILNVNDAPFRKINEVCDYVDYRGKTPQKTKEGIFLVTAKNIRFGNIDYEASKEYISPDDYDEVMRRGKPEVGDVLFTTEAPCGFVAQVDRVDIALAQRVIKYRGHAGVIDNSYLKYVFLGKKFQTKLFRAATGATAKGIKGSKLHQLTIPVPDIKKQEYIVGKLDILSENTNELINNLEQERLARHKQYDYYREKLLAFSDKVKQ